jgi:hypothetical protein
MCSTWIPVFAGMTSVKFINGYSLSIIMPHMILIPKILLEYKGLY